MTDAPPTPVAPLHFGDPPAQPTPYQYFGVAQEATAATHACSGSFTGETDLNVVVAKGSALEVGLVTPRGLDSFRVPLHGAVAGMFLYKPRELLARLARQHLIASLPPPPSARRSASAAAAAETETTLPPLPQPRMTDYLFVCTQEMRFFSVTC